MSIGGQQSQSLDLTNKFDADTGLGIPGDYEAPLIPTAPGDYTFHLTGTIHGQAVDETATSSDSTFNSAVEATDIQFPNKLPSLTEVTTSLDRINARLSASPSPVASPPRACRRARASADTALTDAVGGGPDDGHTGPGFRVDRADAGPAGRRARGDPRSGGPGARAPSASTSLAT